MPLQQPFFCFDLPGRSIPELAALVLDITALMELVDALTERHSIEQVMHEPTVDGRHLRQ